MFKTLKLRIFPTKEQEELLWKHVHGSRFVWNYGLALEKQQEKILSGNILRKEFQKLKNTEEYSWLKEISSHTIAETCSALDKAFKRFFNKTSDYPQFKKKNKTKNSFIVRQEHFVFKNGTVNIEKVGKVKIKPSKDKLIKQILEKEKFYNTRVTYINNKWIVIFAYECKNQAKKLENYSLGIDLGVRKLAVISYNNNFKTFENINQTKKVKRLKERLKFLMKKQHRKYATNNRLNKYENKWHKSNNILKVEEEIRKVYKKLSNIRHNHIHQITHEIVSLFPQKIIMEDLDIKQLLKNKYKARIISEQKWSSFIKIIKYKCEERGIEFKQVSKFYPSSQICSNCGFIHKNLGKEEIYICPKCNLVIDRDLNAALNLSRQ